MSVLGIERLGLKDWDVDIRHVMMEGEDAEDAACTQFSEEGRVAIISLNKRWTPKDPRRVAKHEIGQDVAFDINRNVIAANTAAGEHLKAFVFEVEQHEVTARAIGDDQLLVPVFAVEVTLYPIGAGKRDFIAGLSRGRIEDVASRREQRARGKNRGGSARDRRRPKIARRIERIGEVDLTVSDRDAVGEHAGRDRVVERCRARCGVDFPDPAIRGVARVGGDVDVAGIIER